QADARRSAPCRRDVSGQPGARRTLHMPCLMATLACQPLDVHDTMIYSNEPGDRQVGDAATDQAAHQAQQSIAWLTRSAYPRTIGEALSKLIVEQRIIKVDKSCFGYMLIKGQN
ncbi:hypothetical protein K2Z83_08950, partial [Oscillochloris sp. ZM17-4]|uniref:hypothetical protein n=1 Tax=Oscillochloris sp. ZM17-4 TaxID=2866714 RepID=UPI001C73C774